MIKSAKKATTRKWLKSLQKSKKVSERRDCIVLVLLSAQAERVYLSRMRDLQKINKSIFCLILLHPRYSQLMKKEEKNRYLKDL